jgi:EPS-associated MarR family transcriptional regulator
MALNSTDTSSSTVLTLEHPPTLPATVMPSDRSQDKDFIQYKVLTLLKQHPDLSQRDMAQRLGISNGGMHYCLSALMDKGLVKLGNFANSKHKLGYVYLLTPQGMAKKAAMASRFLERKMAEYEALRAEIEALKLDAQSVATPSIDIN